MLIINNTQSAGRRHDGKLRNPPDPDDFRVSKKNRKRLENFFFFLIGTFDYPEVQDIFQGFAGHPQSSSGSGN